MTEHILHIWDEVTNFTEEQVAAISKIRPLGMRTRKPDPEEVNAPEPGEKFVYREDTDEIKTVVYSMPEYSWPEHGCYMVRYSPEDQPLQMCGVEKGVDERWHAILGDNPILKKFGK